MAVNHKVLEQLAFKCHCCGNCCKLSDPIRIYKEDIERLAKFLKIPFMEAKKKYTRLDPDGELSLKQTLPCGFLDLSSNLCKIYDARPYVCRAYPFLSGLEDFSVTTGCKYFDEIENEEQGFNRCFKRPNHGSI